ncbi:hypothetical protein TrCOL_g7987 [Triparma columacea]|uniref:Tyrosine specific protein phosphatases domain-containing protein n=1 Tax=Triparma columacea TaxID=722753 RepID=A0A9W7LEF0_9STRA|nr:hypothetical protein TrCOL_g7987 [Triparma columacea]
MPQSLLHPTPTSTRCYFKSTDGHVNIHDFSTQRLNLPLFNLASITGGVVLVDSTKSSKKKSMPDSFSRTIPLWCAVLNSLHAHLSSPSSLPPSSPSSNAFLFTPSSCVPPSEHSAMLSKINDVHVPYLLSLGDDDCISSTYLLSTFTKPLRCYWLTRSESGDLCYEDGQVPSPENFTCIICVNASRRIRRPPLWEGPEDVDLGENGAASGYFYSPGAGDDHEGWARGLTPAMFWDHHEEILRLPRTEDSVDSRIDHIVKSYPKDSISQGTEREYDDGSYDKIGDSGIYVGSRSSGRPPGCWERFDAIVNVTMNEYENMADTIGTIGKHYLCCPVEEGKRDKTELEKWLPVVLLFFGIHGVSRGGKVLIHCAQGKDRSVAIAMVCLAVFGDKRELALEEGWYSENELVPPARLSRS